MYKYFLSLRYFHARMITFMAILLVAVGVMVLVVVLSVMGGFQKQFKERLRGTLSHVILEQKSRYGLVPKVPIDRVEQTVRQASPWIRGVAPKLTGLVLVGRSGDWSGCQVYGIDYDKEVEVGKLKEYLLTNTRLKKNRLIRLFEQRRHQVEFKIKQYHVDEKYNAVDLFLSEIHTGFPGEALGSVRGLRKFEGKREIWEYDVFLRFSLEGRLLGEARYDEVQGLRRRFGDELQDFPAASIDRNEVEKDIFLSIQRWNALYAKQDLDGLIAGIDSNHFDRGGLQLEDPLGGMVDEVPPILVGIDLFRRYRMGRGRKIELLTGVEDPETQELKAKRRQFRVVGAFKSGMVEYDKQLIYGRLEDMKRFFEVQDADTISVSLKDIERGPEVQQVLRGVPDLAGWWVSTWEDKRSNLLAAVRMEKFVMKIILGLIVLLALVTIVVILILLIIEKTRDIGILKSLGASSLGVMQIFVLNGFLIAFFGSLLGVSGGILFVENVNKIENKIYDWTGHRLYPRDIYYLDQIPSDLDTGDILTVVIVTLVTSLLLCAIPAIKAARLDPVEAFQYE